MPDNAGYMWAAYIALGVLYAGYALYLFRRKA